MSPEIALVKHPLKPAEPTGDGAVVEANGMRWVRIAWRARGAELLCSGCEKETRCSVERSGAGWLASCACGWETYAARRSAADKAATERTRRGSTSSKAAVRLLRRQNDDGAGHC